ncbi:hypothetical protein GGQ84_001052 [Desulfitispora alkaliphila]
MSYFEIMQLPYSVYLGLYRQFYIINLESTEEGREALERGRMLNETKPDLNKIRQKINNS